MKIILIGTVPSSLINFRGPLIRDLVARGHEVYAFGIGLGAEHEEKVKALGAIPVSYELSRSGANPLSDFLATFKLARKIKSIQPDLVFAYFTKPVIFGGIAARLAGVENVVGMIEGLGYSFTVQPTPMPFKARIVKSIQISLYKIAIPLLKTVIFLNKDDPVDLLEKYKIRAKRVEILGGIGVDLDEYPYTPAQIQPITFIFVGRLLREKGIFEFLEAAKRVKRKYPNVRFVVLGRPDANNPGSIKLDELDNLVQAKVITYPGSVPNVQQWLKESSVFVLPSYREGVPRSTQEAMAVGRAVITTDVPGCRETVEDGVNGFLVAPWDSEALAEKMEWFIDNPDKALAMGERSREMAVVKFGVEKVNQKLITYLLGKV